MTTIIRTPYISTTIILLIWDVKRRRCMSESQEAHSDPEGDIFEPMPMTKDDFNRSMEKRIEQTEEFAELFTEKYVDPEIQFNPIEAVCLIFPALLIAFVIGYFKF